MIYGICCYQYTLHYMLDTISRNLFIRYHLLIQISTLDHVQAPGSCKGCQLKTLRDGELTLFRNYLALLGRCWYSRCIQSIHTIRRWADGGTRPMSSLTFRGGETKRVSQREPRSIASCFPLNAFFWWWNRVSVGGKCCILSRKNHGNLGRSYQDCPTPHRIQVQVKKFQVCIFRISIPKDLPERKLVKT